jgi:hypothetical protein
VLILTEVLELSPNSWTWHSKTLVFYNAQHSSATYLDPQTGACGHARAHTHTHTHSLISQYLYMWHHEENYRVDRMFPVFIFYLASPRRSMVSNFICKLMISNSGYLNIFGWSVFDIVIAASTGLCPSLPCTGRPCKLTCSHRFQT